MMCRWKALIILSLLVPLLQGCSALRLAYGNGPQLAWWWLDGYVDFSREQTPAAKRAVDEFFDWHRRTQLGDYAALLAAAQAQVTEPASAAQVCRWNDTLREKLEPSLQHGLQQAAELLPGLGEAQFKAIERKYARLNDETRNDFLQPDPAVRQAKNLERAIERTERLYGSLDEPQRRVIREGVAASPFNPQLWLAERQRRQRDTLQTLRRLNAERADAAQRLAALRALVGRTEQSPDPEYRAYRQKLVDYNCELGARIHNATTAAQRQRARERLQGWEADLRALAAGS